MRPSQAAVVATALFLSCCAPKLTNPVAQLAIDATAAQTAEDNFMTAFRRAECSANLLNGVVSSGFDFDPSVPCQTPYMSDQEQKARRELLAVIVTYAQALADLEDVSTTEVDSVTKSAAAQFSTDAKANAFGPAFSNNWNIASALTSGLSTAMDQIVNGLKDKKVQEVARSRQEWITAVVEALKNQNRSEAMQASGTADQVATALGVLRMNPGKMAEVAVALTVYEAYRGPIQVTMPISGTSSAQAANDAFDQFLACHTFVAAGGNVSAIPSGMPVCKLEFVAQKPS